MCWNTNTLNICLLFGIFFNCEILEYNKLNCCRKEVKTKFCFQGLILRGRITQHGVVCSCKTESKSSFFEKSRRKEIVCTLKPMKLVQQITHHAFNQNVSYKTFWLEKKELDIWFQTIDFLQASHQTYISLLTSLRRDSDTNTIFNMNNTIYKVWTDEHKKK